MAIANAKAALAQQMAKRLKKRVPPGLAKRPGGLARPVPKQPVGISNVAGVREGVLNQVVRGTNSASGVPPAPTGMKPGRVGGPPGLARGFRRKRRLAAKTLQSKAASFTNPSE